MKIQKSRWLAFGILLFLISPFLVLVAKFQMATQFDISEFFWALKNTVFQALLSAVGSLLLGTWTALGLLVLSEKWKRRAEILCLCPNFLPPVFTLLVLLQWIDPYPVGIFGVAFAHAIINFGLVAVSLSRSIESRLGTLAEVAYVQGSSRRNFLVKILFPLLKKEYLVLALFVFSICFASFSIPLIVGGGKGTTLEVLIYEKLRLSLEWGSAVVLSIIQLIILSFFSVVLLKKESTMSPSYRDISWFGFRSGFFFLLIFCGFFVWGYLTCVFSGFSKIGLFSEFKSNIIFSTFGTLFVGFSTGFLILFLLGLISLVHQERAFRFFLRAYVAPSTTLTGFAFLVLGPNEGVFSYIKIPIALSMLFIGPLYRIGWESELDQIQGQISVADTLGAKWRPLFWKIIWPQVSSRAFLIAGLASAWACGDFALTRILAYKDMTLGLMTETLMATYRFGMASVLSFVVLMCGLFCFLTFWSLGHVYRRKAF